MATPPPSGFRHPQTPRPVKLLILLTLFVSLVAATGHHLFTQHLGGSFTLKDLLSLSVDGIEHHFFWQLITYPFLYPFNEGITFSFLLALAVNLYVFWALATSIIEKKKARHFFSLFFGTAILVGLLVYALLSCFGSTQLFSGNGPLLYSLGIAWAILFADAQLLLFFSVPIRPKWLFGVILGVDLLIDVSSGEYLRAFSYIIGTVSGYFYTLFIWKLKSPFKFLNSFEKVVLKLLAPAAPDNSYIRAKIYDFKTGKAILSDEDFLDAMQRKAAAKGKKSLSWKERWRMYKILKKKK